MLARLCIAVLIGLLAPAAAAQEEAACTAFPHAAPTHQPPTLVADIQHARISAEVDAAESAILGKAEIDLAVSAPVDSLVLFSPHARVDSLFAGTGGTPGFPVPFRRSGFDSLTVDLTALRESGIDVDSTLKLGISFRSTARFGENAAWTLDLTEPWFPWTGRLDDRFSAELAVEVPTEWTVAAPGFQTAHRTDEDGGEIFLFTSPQELPPTELDFIATSVEPSITFARLPGGRQAGVVTLGGEVIPETADLLTFFSDWTDLAYPFDRYSQHIGRGIRSTSSAAMSTAPLTAMTAEATSGVSSVLGPLIARQWFGTIVSPQSVEDVWLNEGLSAYLGALSLEGQVGFDAFMRTLRQIYEAEAQRYVRPLVWNRWNHPSEMLDAHARAKGAWVMHMLRERVGDEEFQAAIRLFLREHAFESANTEDLIDAFEEVTSDDLSSFAEEWMYSAGHPVLGVSYAPEGERLRIRFEQLQSGDGVQDPFTLHLTIEVGALGSGEQFEVTVDEAVEELHVPFSAQPRYVAVDPDDGWLLSVRTDQSAAAWIAQLRYASTAKARLEAAEALAGADQDPALLLGLRAAFETEDDAAVRAAIVRAMGNLDTEAARRAVIAAFEDPSPAVRAASLDALSAGVGAAVELAMRAAQEDPDYHVQAHAVRTLADLEAPEALEIARSALITSSRGDVIRTSGLYALQLLYRQEPRVALEAGRTYAGSEYPISVRVQAVRLLGELGQVNTAAVGQLEHLLSASDEDVRRAAATQLHAIGRTERLRAALPDAAPSFAPFLSTLLSCE